LWETRPELQTLWLNMIQLHFLLSFGCLQGPAGITAVLHCMLQHLPDPDISMLTIH
jgi:hypothetical protein